MTRARDLVAGNCYFMVNFYDDDLKVPDVSTYLYEREDVWDDGEKIWLFREPIVDLPSSDDEDGDEEESHRPVLTAIHEDQLHRILDINGLIATLGELVHLHPLIAAPAAADGELELRRDIPEVSNMVSRILSFEDRHSVTITILHTDDGISISRDEKGLYASFFPEVRREAEHERGIRALFANLGIAPYQDYLAQHERVRVLCFRLPAERPFLEGLTKRLLIDIYRMRQTDALCAEWSVRPG
jgi:hypothetical protein